MLLGVSGEIFSERNEIVGYFPQEVCHVAFGDNETNELNHSSVLHDADDDSFQLWTAFQNGGDGVFQPFPKQKWIDKKCHGILLSQSGSNGGQPI